MNRIISSLDAIALHIPEEVTKAVIESPDTFDSLGTLIIPTLALVVAAVIGIIFFSRKTKTE